MKKRKIISSVISIFISLSLCFVSFAHGGRTDGSGGHKDNKNASGLGSYHYHCGGHPAHLHPNGVCPYASGSTSKTTFTAPKIQLYPDFKATYALGYTTNEIWDKDTIIATDYPARLSLANKEYNSTSCHYYIWNDNAGWVNFANGDYATCDIWNSGVSIKQVLNGDKNIYNIKSFSVALLPGFSVYNNDTYIYNAIPVLNNYTESCSIYTNEIPMKISLSATAKSAQIYSWYIWNDGVGWVYFSGEQNPNCNIWSPMGTNIKLIYNNNPNYYKILSVTKK